MLCLWLSCDFPMIFLSFSHDFAVICSWVRFMIFLGCSCDFRMVFSWFVYGFPEVVHRFSYGVPMVSRWFPKVSHSFPLVSHIFSYGVPMIVLWFFLSFPPLTVGICRAPITPSVCGMPRDSYGCRDVQTGK